MTSIPPELAAAREAFMKLVAEVRPELHRYCSRLVGSAIDGEDVVQESLGKAYYAVSFQTELPPLRPWLFRIAHNTAIDFLRRYDRRFVEPMAQVPEASMVDVPADPEVVRMALSSFVSLPVLQRSAVILKDVLGCSLEEIATTTGSTVPAVKAALVRGRAAIGTRTEPELVPWRDKPETSAEDRERLGRYVDLFNARNWVGIEELLGEECRLDLLAKNARRGKKQVGLYFTNYAKEPSVRLELGKAEGREVIGVYIPAESISPAYVVSIEWRGGKVDLIRDYRYVPYLVESLDYERETTV